MSTCSKCGKQTKWVRTEQGRQMEVDPEMKMAGKCRSGTIMIDENGKMFNAYAVPRDKMGYPLHLSTCGIPQ